MYTLYIYIIYIIYTYILVDGFNPSEKILVNGKDYPMYYGKKKIETTNQNVQYINIYT